MVRTVTLVVGMIMTVMHLLGHLEAFLHASG